MTEATTLEEEAAGWVARMSSADATPADHRAFRRWQAADPAHAAAYAELQALWGELGAIRAASLKPKGRSRRAVLAGLALLGGGAAAAPALNRLVTARLRADHATAIGEIRSLRLPDGSLASLDTDSAIALDFTEDARRLRLLRGQCFFEVAHAPARPFTVAGPELTARALGTRFALSAAGDGLPARVLVEQGEVAVSDGGAPLLLAAGEAACHRDGQLQREARDIAAATAWRRGQLVFSGEPLGQVLRRLGRYRHDRLLVLDHATAERRVSGIFDLADTDQALQSIARSQPVAITRIAGLVTLIRARG